jgi:hypothetical protein
VSLTTSGNDLNQTRSRITAQGEASLLNWYADHRRLDRQAVDGGEVKAWWPFEWFSENFNSIADSIVATLLLGAARRSTTGLARLFRETIAQIKCEFDPYPEPVLRAKRNDQTLEEFTSYLEEEGLNRKYFFVFRLTSEELEAVATDLMEGLLRFRQSLDQSDIGIVDALAERPVLYGAKGMYSSRLRSQKIARLVESGPDMLWLVLYPLIYEGEF